MRAVRAARDRRSHVRTPRGRSPPCSRGGPSSLHGLCAHRTLQSNENQPCFFQPKDSLCFKKCIFATSGKHLTTESAGKAVVRETHSLIPAGGLPRVGGTERGNYKGEREKERRPGQRGIRTKSFTPWAVKTETHPWSETPLPFPFPCLTTPLHVAKDSGLTDLGLRVRGKRHPRPLNESCVQTSFFLVSDAWLLLQQIHHISQATSTPPSGRGPPFKAAGLHR